MDILEAAIGAWREHGYDREDILERWSRRIPPFKGIEEDTRERHQIMPFPAPPVNQQTHRRNGREGYRDGSAENLDA
jgi:hypothetical protein